METLLMILFALILGCGEKPTEQKELPPFDYFDDTMITIDFMCQLLYDPSDIDDYNSSRLYVSRDGQYSLELKPNDTTQLNLSIDQGDSVEIYVFGDIWTETEKLRFDTLFYINSDTLLIIAPTY